MHRWRRDCCRRTAWRLVVFVVVVACVCVCVGVQELVEAGVLPMTHAARFKAIGIKPPKGVLLYGPPGTGKTLLARACARQTDAVFLKLAGPQLVQMFIGDGAKVRGHRMADGGARVSAYCFRPRSRRSDVGSGGGVTRQWSL